VCYCLSCVYWKTHGKDCVCRAPDEKRTANILTHGILRFPRSGSFSGNIVQVGDFHPRYHLRATVKLWFRIQSDGFSLKLYLVKEICVTMLERNQGKQEVPVLVCQNLRRGNIVTLHPISLTAATVGKRPPPPGGRTGRLCLESSLVHTRLDLLLFAETKWVMEYYSSGHLVGSRRPRASTRAAPRCGRRQSC
jgi:hypothetical protein